MPDLRAPVDLAIVERAATLFRPLGAEAGWGAHFGRELNATDDRAYFAEDAADCPSSRAGRSSRFASTSRRRGGASADRDARRLLGHVRYERPRLAYRDVASATNRLTLIAAILPAGCVSTHTVFCLRTPLPLAAQHFLCGVFNSFVVNYLVRLRVTTHVTTAIGGAAADSAPRRWTARVPGDRGARPPLSRDGRTPTLRAASGVGGGDVPADRGRVRAHSRFVSVDTSSGTRSCTASADQRRRITIPKPSALKGSRPMTRTGR